MKFASPPIRKFFAIAAIVIALLPTSCVAPLPAGSTSTTNAGTGNARNWVLIMHGESCGSADDVASNMYVENNHETASITVTVDISWTEGGQPRHENKTLIVSPNSKALIGCDLRNGVYVKMEIVNAVYS